jgi:TctA family transporter
MKLDLILAKVFKFVVFVIFTFMTLVYFGVLLVLPLDVLFQIVRIFSAIGLPTALAAVAGIAAFGYLGYALSKMPAVWELVLDIGKQLVAFGQAQLQRFDAVIEEAAGAPR